MTIKGSPGHRAGESRAETARRIHTSMAQYVAQNSLRRSPERDCVVEAVLAMRGSFSSVDLWESLQARHGAKAPARSTVFAALRLMSEAGILGRDVADPRLWAVAGPTQASGFLTLVCDRCGHRRALHTWHANVPEICADALDPRAWRSVPRFTPKRVSITLTGTCSRCIRLDATATSKNRPQT